MSEVPQVSAPAEGEFPNGPTVRGRYYATSTPWDEQVVIMSMETWVDFGTTLESLRRVAKSQDDRIKELIAATAAAGIAREDADKRLNALRDIRRAEKRADLEGGIYLPPERKLHKGR